MKFSGFTPEIKSAPLLGEHTVEILKELNYSDDEITALKNSNAI